jgi:hypothetical protein
MVSCPVCGWQMRTGDVQPGRFRCPGCNAGLHVPEASGYEQAIVVLGSGMLGFLVPYLMGARGFWTLYLCVILLYIPMAAVLGLVRGFLFPRALKRDSPNVPGLRVGNVLHIDDRPDPQNKS